MDRPRSTVIAAIEANVLLQTRAFALASPQIRICDEGRIFRIESGLPHPYVNRVLRARFPAPLMDQQIREVVTSYRSREVPVSWMVGPSSAPVDLGDHLLRAGLIRERDEVGMAMDLASLSEELAMPPGLAVQRVVDRAGLEQWTEIVGVSFGLAGYLRSLLCNALAGAVEGDVSAWRLFLGVLDGNAVGASRLFLHSDVAGVYHVATLPEARRRGVGPAMTLAALSEGKRLGYPLAVLRATPLAESLYGRLGFKKYCRFNWYLWPKQGIRWKLR